jgi:hypothetical protein
MAQQDLLSKVVQALDRSGSAYMLTGSFASSMQGEPRLSHDIDLVVDLAMGEEPGKAVHTLTFFGPLSFFVTGGILPAITFRSIRSTEVRNTGREST